MEEAEVKQLISLIESAQLQYEVDESGTVSIVCDPVQLVDSAGIDTAHSNVDLSATSLLAQHNETTIPTEEGSRKDGIDIIIQDSERREDEKGLEATKEIKVENEKMKSNPPIDSSHVPDTPGGSSSPIHYFLQTPDGEIIQVLDSLEAVDEESTEGVNQALEDITTAENFTGSAEATDDENMQILVVRNGAGGDMFFINASERHMIQENGDSMDVSQAMLKSSGTDESVDEYINKDRDEIVPLTSDHSNVTTKTPENLFLNVALMEDDPNISKASEISSKTQRPQLRANLRRKKAGYSREVTLGASSTNNKHYIKLNSQAKPRLPLRDTGTFESLAATLAEGALVQTDKGEMMAYSLSSVTKDQPSGKKKTVLQNIASSFGSWVKVLRPIDQEKEVTSTNVKKRFPLFSCDDCGTMLHSERSLKIHRRRFHEEWDDECFICGDKFLNLHYVRSHIREIHSEEKSFECRYCSFRCSLIKEFFKHCRVHKKSQVCSNCGKKYASPKLFREHVANCNSKADLDFDYMNDVGCEEYPMKITKGFDKKERCLAYQTSLDIVPSSRKKSGKLEQNTKKRDLEYKVESKHYSQQIKKMALEPPIRDRSRGRYRTHRCYLCFKFFSNSADLDAHKEVYHQVKSSNPVRVKTDDSLGREEEDVLEICGFKNESLGDGMNEDVQIKSEPPDITENIDNVTIVLDEYMNLSLVIKPLCIACKAYTKTDFRETCKLFQNLSKYDQSEALKNFEKFFPFAIDPESLKGPWVLCKKCSLLIDKIADMEEKLITMKSDLMLRLQGNNTEIISTDESEAGKCIDDSYFKREQIDSKCSSNDDLSCVKASEDINKSLVDIESYMKENCEIMEIIRPHKKNRNTRKHEVEKLAPILLIEDEQEEFNISDAAKMDLRKEEINGIKGDQTTKESCGKNSIILGSVKKEVVEELVDKSIEIPGTNIKSEPLQRDLESILPHTDTSAWEDLEGNPLNSVEQLQEDDFLIPMSKSKKDNNSQLDSGLFATQLLSQEEVDCGTSQKESHKMSKVEMFEKGDDDDDDTREPVCQRMRETGSPHPVYLPSSSQEALNQIKVKSDEGGDSTVQFTRIQKPVLKGLETKHQSEENIIKEDTDSSKCLENIPDDHVAAKEEKINIKSHEPSETSTMGKKRAKRREERNLMSYRLEGNVAKPWVCSGCHKGFSTQRGACDHYAASHGGQSYSCEHCSASYVRKRDLIGHYNRVHLKAKPYKCKKCSDSFSMHSQLYRHIQNTHREEKKEPMEYKCHLCQTTFSQKRYRDAHVAICETKGSDVTPYTCLHCDKSFKLEKYLRLHMKTSHSVKSDAFFCEICNKVLNDKRNLILHMKSHNGETKTSCSVCHKQFSRKAYLWTHMRVHTNERPYGCNYCPKWFKQYSTWKNHERTHTGEKPYKCNICHNCFATSSSVSKHLQYAHYNIRDFGCDLCQKYFISKAKLDEHMKTHTGEKPFECPICNRAFNKKTNLRIHMYIHSTNKRFKCELCGEGFMRRTAIENHILDRHSDLEFILGTNISNSQKGKAEGVAAATSPFISVVGADDVNSEDTYIVVYADEEEEAETSKDMEVTVLAEDMQNTQVETTSKHLHLSVVQNQISGSLSANVIPKVIIKEETSVEENAVLPTLITTANEVASTNPVQENPTQIAYL